MIKININSNKNDNMENLGNFPSCDLQDLLADDQDQIVNSEVLFNAFIKEASGKINYNPKDVKKLYTYSICLYNDTFEVYDKMDALSYMKGIVNCLDYITASNLMELSLEQLNQILENTDGESIKLCYMKIKNNRHLITEKDFKLYCEMLKNNHNRMINKENVFSYIASIYNCNPILQDNVKYTEYLSCISRFSKESVLSMRMIDFLSIFNIQNVNYETINESKMLINDIEGLCYGTL